MATSGDPSVFPQTDPARTPLWGTDNSEVLRGTAGRDVVLAGGGDDVVFASDGWDALDGGAGIDTFMTSDAFGDGANVRFDGTFLQLGPSWRSDPLLDVEFIVFSDGAFDVTRRSFTAQNNSANSFTGSLTVQGTAASELLLGVSGSDSIVAGAGADTVAASTGNDTVYGNQGSDLLYGQTGDDRLFGGQDADTVVGGQGQDMLFGNLGDDRLYGNLGDDTLSGGQGNDLLYGGQGQDVLMGGRGEDTLVGGLGADRYVFAAFGGADVVVGFNAAEGDRLDLSGLSYTVGSGAGGAAVLTLGDSSTVTLLGVAAEQVNASFFA